MKSRISVSLLAAAALLFCASFMLVRGVLTQGAQTSPQTATSLRERARRSGKLTVKVFPHSLNRYDRLDHLVRDSPAVVLGTVVSQASRVSTHSERAVTTDYAVRVDDALKGNLPRESLVSVHEIGGKLSFEDGTSVETATPDYWKTPQPGKTYVLFLTPKDGGEYKLVGGPQGLFEVGASGVKPQGLATDELFRAHHGMGLKKFTDRVRATVENQERAALRGAAAN